MYLQGLKQSLKRILGKQIQILYCNSDARFLKYFDKSVKTQHQKQKYEARGGGNALLVELRGCEQGKNPSNLRVSRNINFVRTRFTAIFVIKVTFFGI